jgi:hypothetical protein
MTPLIYCSYHFCHISAALVLQRLGSSSLCSFLIDVPVPACSVAVETIIDHRPDRSQSTFGGAESVRVSKLNTGIDEASSRLHHRCMSWR